ncbi:MAG: hypothetical protein NMNS02_00130 [Nitrosomonas sp.]|nr:MAG: hypothetical protein NMNS02_00130 [Nitrosomonas sp.]
MEQEVSTNAVVSQQDNNAAREVPAATAMVTTAATVATVTATATTNDSGNPRPVLKNQLHGELFGNTTITTRIEAATLSLEVNAPHANDTDYLPVIDPAQLFDLPTVTTSQTTAPILPQSTPVQKFQANNAPGQPYYTANSAATNQIMPPSAEAISNSTPPAEITTFALTSDTTQPAATDNSSILAASAPSPSTQSTALKPADISLDVQLGQPKWEGEFAQKIVWLAGQQQQAAEIRLNPAHLGPVEIMLSITNDQGVQQATAQFLSPHLAAREAIEAALPKLREMMADNGITLGNVTVDSNSSQQQKDAWQQENAAKRFAANQPGARSESTDQQETTIITRNHLGIVNTFA